MFLTLMFLSLPRPVPLSKKINKTYSRTTIFKKRNPLQALNVKQHRAAIPEEKHAQDDRPCTLPAFPSGHFPNCGLAQAPPGSSARGKKQTGVQGYHESRSLGGESTGRRNPDTILKRRLGPRPNPMLGGRTLRPPGKQQLGGSIPKGVSGVIHCCEDGRANVESPRGLSLIHI